MIHMKDKVLSLAKSYVGYLEKASNYKLEDKTANSGSANYTIFAKKYADYGFGNFQGQPWCAMAVTVLFYDALGKDKASRVLTPYAYCPYGVNHWKQKGRWHSKSGYTPQKGDVIFFYNGAESTHTGLVYDVKNGSVYTYEGNTSDGTTLIPNGGAFCQKSYDLDYSRILGYGNPDWESIEEELTVNQYEELKQEIAQLKAENEKLKEAIGGTFIYNYIDSNMPEWAKEAVQWCVDNGIITGTNSNGDLGLNHMKRWTCVVVYRVVKWIKK